MMYKRIFAWICYFSFIFTICILFVITDAYWLFMLIPLLILLPLFSFCLLILQKCTVQIRLAKRDDHIWVQIEDHFIFGHPLIELQIKEYNAFTKEENIQTISLFNDQVYPSEHFAPGMINLTVQKIRCFDILHLFSLQERKKKIEIAFLQLPQEAHSSSHNALQTYIASKRREDAWQDKHEVREYRPGDAFRWIHHKLSYKSGKLMIREFENVSHSTIHLLLDLSGSIMQCKETLALYQGIAKALLTENIHLQIIYYSEQRQQMIELQQIEDVTSSLYQIISQPKSSVQIFPFPVKKIQQGLYAIKQEGADHNDTMAL
ncbi:DUF58 domain-containing protein [Merdibacter massiliensis]|uniref:DUF58 domain-containing protein n=1 Tax=Merdibacter massiliensis TaxID=1871030 RepID=UPI00096ACA2C|nr:DUF58 domain-containing protein [Merdibacter massiliensis]